MDTLLDAGTFSSSEVSSKGLVSREIMGGTQERREGPKLATPGLGAWIKLILAISNISIFYFYLGTK